MKVSCKEYGQPVEILKYNDFLGAPCMVSNAGVVSDANGKKIVKAGTPWPKNDATCMGILLHDVDVTYGEAPGTYVFEGSIDNTKLTKNNVSVAAEAKAKLPRVTFFD
ncbi:hypothetical protein [Robinsoniella peoriensis]|uniref:hypothetical protein n=1 Tax=Robinsoniella peoriensis TaxID=180332 RepID=UPI00085C3D9B|nr:hypothetical protein [Robinsoniella peoriensis]MDU7031283.1 hypothetical protein [Clostridiales bacterium]